MAGTCEQAMPATMLAMGLAPIQCVVLVAVALCVSAPPASIICAYSSFDTPDIIEATSWNVRPSQKAIFIV